MELVYFWYMAFISDVPLMILVRMKLAESLSQVYVAFSCLKSAYQITCRLKRQEMSSTRAYGSSPKIPMRFSPEPLTLARYIPGVLKTIDTSPLASTATTPPSPPAAPAASATQLRQRREGRAQPPRSLSFQQCPLLDQLPALFQRLEREDERGGDPAVGVRLRARQLQSSRHLSADVRCPGK